MAAYDTEIRAVQARMAEVESELETRISVIQQDAHQQIFRAIRAADEELFRARLFLSSVSGSQPRTDAAKAGSSEVLSEKKEVKATRGKRRTTSPKKSAVRKVLPAVEGPRKSVRVMLLEMLAGAEKGIPESEIDAAVAALGLTKDASRKAKGFAKGNGTVEERGGLLFITPAGRDSLNGSSTG